MSHGVPEIEMNDDLNFSAMAQATNKYPGKYRLSSFRMPWWRRY